MRHFNETIAAQRFNKNVKFLLENYITKTFNVHSNLKWKHKVFGVNIKIFKLNFNISDIYLKRVHNVISCTYPPKNMHHQQYRGSPHST